LAYDFWMSIGSRIQAWRVSRGHSTAALAQTAGLSERTLEAIESNELDPAVSVFSALAGGLGIPVSWLFADPRHIELLADSDDDAGQMDLADPVIAQVLRTVGKDLEMYVLLTVILQDGEPKLVRAAEASLRSLVKQSKRPTVPWQSRPQGHFEPPSD
jgi:transcriptional regulator with XRE-family HTH domain